MIAMTTPLFSARTRAMLVTGIALFSPAFLFAQTPTLPPEIARRAESSPLRLHFLQPTRVVWKSEGVKNADRLLDPKPGQATLKDPPPCVLAAQKDKPAGILLDFGV